MHQFGLTDVAQDLIKALGADGTYAAIGTAGAEDGSITTTVVTTDDDGARHRVDVRISQAA